VPSKCTFYTIPVYERQGRVIGRGAFGRVPCLMFKRASGRTFRLCDNTDRAAACSLSVVSTIVEPDACDDSCDNRRLSMTPDVWWESNNRTVLQWKSFIAKGYESRRATHFATMTISISTPHAAPEGTLTCPRLNGMSLARD
jgi:hypothetical protein